MDATRNEIHEQWMRALEASEHWDEAFDRTEAVLSLLPDDVIAWAVMDAADDEGGGWSRRVIVHDGDAIFVLAGAGTDADALSAAVRRIRLSDIVDITVQERGERQRTGRTAAARTWTFRTADDEIVIDTGLTTARGIEVLARSIAQACGWNIPEAAQ